MSDDPTAGARLTLRDLPLPVKVVLTCFLLAVGLGYSAAMVQLHFQDSKSGKPMPGFDDVILKFTGKKWFTTSPDAPVSKFVKLVTAPEQGPPFNGAGTMSPAFFSKDPEFNKVGRANEAQREHLRAERTGERDALVLWANAPPTDRENAYKNDHFDPKDKLPAAITPKFVEGGAVKVKSIIDARCATCHAKGEPQEKYPLTTYAEVEKYLAVPPAVTVPSGGGWVKVEEPIGLEKLTQSTHAHLLSFAVLFAMTGLIFAFSSYPTVVRCVLGPWTLLAVVTDVAFWWLARLSDQYGVYFAMGVIGTGAAAGLGLGAQITLSLWNMYGAKGKFVLLLLFAGGGATAGLVFLTVIKPGLDAKQQAIEAAHAKPAEQPVNAETPKKKDENPPKKDDTTPKKVDAGAGGQVAKMLAFPVKSADGKEIPVRDVPFKKEQAGGMLRAFFDKDSGEFAAALKEKDVDAQKKLIPERHGEREALLAWSRLPEAERRKAYEADAFDLPAGQAGKPLTKDYLAGSKVKVRTLVTDRCIRCHADEEKAPFDSYDSLLKYLDPKPAGKP